MNKKNYILAVAIIIMLSTGFLYSNSMSVEGYWKTIDDDTKEVKSIVKLWVEDGKMKGRIVKIYPKKGEDPNPKCDKCKGDKKDKLILGMEFMWGYEGSGGEWRKGRILDPENGKVYKSQLELVDNGKKLEVFGYIRVIFKIGRTQTWLRSDYKEENKG